MTTKIVNPSDFHKAETYTPTDGMKAAARRALKWKEDGKATGDLRRCRAHAKGTRAQAEGT